jgi:hypothetical protein
VGPRAGLDGCGKYAPPTGIRSPDRPARSESQYRLSYPGPPLIMYKIANLVSCGIILHWLPDDDPLWIGTFGNTDYDTMI